MAIFIQEEFDGGALGSKGMYRDSSLKEKAVKRAINVEPTDEGTLRSRPLTQEIPYEPYTLRTRERTLAGIPPREYTLPLDQPFLPGTRTLPFTWRGDRYALHYTPYHYLSFIFDRDTKASNTVPYSDQQRQVTTNVGTLRTSLSSFLDPGYLRSIESVALHRASSLYNHIYTRGDTVEGSELLFRNFTLLDWTRSTYLYNVYIVFREDGTVVRQGRPHSIRSVEPPEGERIPEFYVTNNLAGGEEPYLVPLYDSATGQFIPGQHELEASFYNQDHMYFGGMTPEAILSTFSRGSNGSILAWSGSLYEENFTPNVRYEFRDLGDTFTFVDVMGTVEPDITFSRDIRQSHAVYFPVTTIAGGAVSQPFPYEGGLEVSSVREEEVTTDLPRPEAAIDTVQREVPITHRGPLVMPSLGAEKGDPTSLDVSGSPSSPVPSIRFSPGHVFFVHGYKSQYADPNSRMFPPPRIEGYAPLDIEIDIRDTLTGFPLEGELFKGLANPSTSGAVQFRGRLQAGAPIRTTNVHTVEAEILRGQGNRVRVFTQGGLGLIPDSLYRTTDYASTGSGTTDTPRRIGLVLRRPSSFYVDNAPRMRMPAVNLTTIRFDDLVPLRTDTQSFFHGAIPEGFKGITIETGTGAHARFLGSGFHMIFDGDVSEDFLSSLERIVFRQEDTSGSVPVIHAFSLANPVIYRGSDLLLRPESARTEVGFPTSYTGSTLFRGIRVTDRVVRFTASATRMPPTQADNAPPLPFAWDNEDTALAGLIGPQSARKTFRVEVYSSEVTTDFPHGRPYWSGFHFDEYAELLVSQQFLSDTSTPARVAYFPGITLRRSEIASYTRTPSLRNEGTDYIQIPLGRLPRAGTDLTDSEQRRVVQTYRLRRLALASLAGGSGYGRAGTYATPADGGYATIDVDTYTEQCRFFLHYRATVTRDNIEYNGLGPAVETPFKFLLDTSTRGNRYALTRTRGTQGGGDATLTPTIGFKAIDFNFVDILVPYFTYGGLPNYDVLLEDTDSDPDVLAFWYPGLVSNNNLTAVTGDSLVYEPQTTSLRGDLFHRIGYFLTGDGFTTSENRYSFPIRLLNDSVLLDQVGRWDGLGAFPSRKEPVRVMPYYSDSLLRRALTEGSGDEAVARSYAGRICLTDLEGRARPVPIYFNSPLAPGTEDTVVDGTLDDYRPLLAVGQNVPQIWRVHQSRLFWFARRSFGASALLDFGDFNSYARSTTEGPLALRLAGDNLLPTGQDDTQVNWAYVYEGNLLVGMDTQIRTLSRENPFTGGQIPTTLVRLPSTNITPVYVRNFLFKVRGDLKGIERLVPTFQYGQRIISTSISNPIYLDYLQDATISYLVEHPTQHGFYVGTSDDRILYGHVAPDGIVSWTEMNYPDRVGPLLRNSFGIFYRTETNLLRYITGGSVSVEPQISCEIELLPLSLIGRRPTGRLNEGSQQADASVIVDMPVGEELIIGRGQTPRSQVIYSDREIREPYRESPEGNEGMLLRYTGSGPFHLVRVSREDNTLIDPRQLYFAKGRPDPRTLGLREI